MVRKGYRPITVSEQLAKEIDAVVDKTDIEMCSRPKVISKAIRELKARKK